MVVGIAVVRAAGTAIKAAGITARVASIVVRAVGTVVGVVDTAAEVVGTAGLVSCLGLVVAAVADFPGGVPSTVVNLPT